MLGLEVESDDAWAEAATKHLDRVLVDHAHCEMKAATNALSLAVKCSGDLVLVRELVELAQEELGHFVRVLAFLEARKLPLGPPRTDAYAASLRSAQSMLPKSPFGGMAGLVDRLIVGSLIEARSCERFKKLVAALGAADETSDRELQAFYQELFECEALHHRKLVDLAVRAAGGDRPKVTARLAALAALEGAIVTGLETESQSGRATVHG